MSFIIHGHQSHPLHYLINTISHSEKGEERTNLQSLASGATLITLAARDRTPSAANISLRSPDDFFLRTVRYVLGVGGGVEGAEVEGAWAEVGTLGASAVCAVSVSKDMLFVSGVRG